MASKLYGKITKAEVIAPEGDEFERVQQCYGDMASIGRVTDEQRRTFFEAGRRLADRGAEAVLLGGTDLFLAFTGRDCGFPVIDCRRSLDIIYQSLPQARSHPSRPRSCAPQVRCCCCRRHALLKDCGRCSRQLLQGSSKTGESRPGPARQGLVPECSMSRVAPGGPLLVRVAAEHPQIVTGWVLPLTTTRRSGGCRAWDVAGSPRWYCDTIRPT